MILSISALFYGSVGIGVWHDGGVTCIMGVLAVCDAGGRWQMGLQEPVSPIMVAISALHYDVMYVLVGILGVVVYMLARGVFNGRNVGVGRRYPMYLLEYTVLELVWTVIPAFLLLAMAVPSYVLLYSIDEVVSPAVTVVAVGNQWYWAYEYNDGGGNKAYDRYMVADEDLEYGQLRVLEVDFPMVLPVMVHIRVLVTSGDVLHSWAVPAMGVKCDAVPGRVNQIGVMLLREGMVYGQCSEICGVQHGFMPIVVEAVGASAYLR